MISDTNFTKGNQQNHQLRKIAISVFYRISSAGLTFKSYFFKDDILWTHYDNISHFMGKVEGVWALDYL